MSLTALPIPLTPPLIIEPKGWRGRALIPALVFIGLLISVVSSVGAPLVPRIAVDYGVSVGTAQWSLTVTFLVGAIASPVIGRLADGPRRLHVLLAALVALTAGSVVAAIPGRLHADHRRPGAAGRRAGAAAAGHERRPRPSGA